LAVLFDGDPALWEWARKLLGLDTEGDVIGILDLFHVSERLWQVAYLFHAEGSEEARAFVETRLWMLLEGRVGRRIGGLRQIATRRGWELKKPKSGPRAKDAPAPKRERKAVKGLRLAVEYFQRRACCTNPLDWREGLRSLSRESMRFVRRKRRSLGFYRDSGDEVSLVCVAMAPPGGGTPPSRPVSSSSLGHSRRV
jgi:hypothetical protein